jgi:hypothetical protein
MEELLKRFGRDVESLMNRLRDGEIDSVQWRKEMRRLLARYHQAAMMIGAGLPAVPPGGESIIAHHLNTGQYPYLDNFATLIQASPEFNQAWYARAKLYSLSPKTSYWEGRVYKVAGKFLPLPAMPAQGTQCHTNCGCAWEVQRGKERDTFICYWRRHKDDSCQTCIEREAQWSPLVVQGQLIVPSSMIEGEAL